MTHIVHISTWNVPCGIATYCDNFVQSLNQRGFENTVAPIETSNWREMLPEDVTEWTQEIVAKTIGADIVHIQHEHGLFGYSLGHGFALKRFSSVLKSVRASRTPCVVTFHTEPPPTHNHGFRGLVSSLRRRLEWQKYVAPYFDGSRGSAQAIVHSSRTRKQFVKVGLSPSSIHVIKHPCLAPRTTRIDSLSAKASLGYDESTRLITLFGFLGRYKGHDQVVEALRHLPENYHFAMVGGMHPEASDDYLDYLLRSMPEGLKSRVRITGWVDKSTAELYFAATDICVAPYRGDTLLSGSGALTWGLSSGKPVIASKIEAFCNVNREGDCLFMVCPDKVQELAWAIQKVDSDSALKERLVANATKFCNEHSWASTVKDIEGVYQLCGALKTQGSLASPVPAAA